MDIFTYIKRDHRKVASLIDDLLAINLSYVRLNIFGQIRTELTLHADAEEQTFYRALDAAGQNGDLIERLHHAADDHEQMRALMEVIDNTPASSDFWMEKFGELKQAIAHHVAEEEQVVFPRARVLLSPQQCRQLARDMDMLKADLVMEMQAPAL